MTPTCYKCGTDTDLSLKRTLKSGNMLFICKSCRRAAYHQSKSVTPKKVADQPHKINRAWVQWAKETNNKLAKKYKDNAFLEAKGLL